MNAQPPIVQQSAQPNTQMTLAQIDRRLADLVQTVEAIAAQQQEVQQVNVLDINMSFGSMVVFMVKWAIAAIPAAIILVILGVLAFAVLSGFLAAL